MVMELQFYYLVPFFMGTCELPSGGDEQKKHDYLLVDLQHKCIVKPARAVPLLPGYQKLYHNHMLPRSHIYHLPFKGTTRFRSIKSSFTVYNKHRCSIESINSLRTL